jgi:hypothetical protein
VGDVFPGSLENPELSTDLRKTHPLRPPLAHQPHGFQLELGAKKARRSRLPLPLLAFVMDHLHPEPKQG